MSRKNKIIVSVVGIFIVLLALIGITYGYFLTRIVGNTNTNSISITTANLRLVYRDGTPLILTKENIQPIKYVDGIDDIENDNIDEPIGTKTFTVTNEGNGVVDYDVYLENIINDFSSPEDVDLVITCSSNKGTTCNGYNSDYPTINSKLISNTITVDEIHTYTLSVYYYDTNTDQSEDMGKTIQGKVQIYDPNDIVTISGTVSNHTSSYYIELLQLNEDGDVVNTKTSEIKSNTYTIPGITPGTYTLNVKYVDEDGATQIKNTKTITISKGTEESVSSDGSTIVITDNTSSIITNINVNDLSILDSELVEKNGNPYTEGTLAYNIYDNAKNNLNGTQLVDAPLTEPVKQVSAFTYTKANDPTSFSSSRTNATNYYIAYALDYEMNPSTGNFKLGTDENSVTIMTTKYVYSSELASTLAGKYAYWSTSEITTDKISNLSSLYKITTTASDITTSTIKYASITKGTYTNAESVLAPTPDADGTSYYFRGGVQDNYVLFNNMCFRIVRIEGDGSVKLTLAGNVSSGATNCNEVTTTSAVLNNYPIYGYETITGLDGTWYLANYSETDGLGLELKTWFDSKFRVGGVSSGNLTSAGTKIKNDTWCLGGSYDYKYDRTTGERLDNNALVPNSSGYYEWNYSSGKRMWTTQTTDLTCGETEESVNSLVGTLTVDEAALAGFTTYSVGNSYTNYLYENAQNKYYWTLSRACFNDYSDYAFYVDGGYLDDDLVDNYDLVDVRPAVSLVTGTQIVDGGVGTKTNPYVISVE